MCESGVYSIKQDQAVYQPSYGLPHDTKRVILGPNIPTYSIFK